MCEWTERQNGVLQVASGPRMAWAQLPGRSWSDIITQAHTLRVQWRYPMSIKSGGRFPSVPCRLNRRQRALVDNLKQEG